MKNFLRCFLLLLVLISYGQEVVYIPDTNWKNCLLNREDINANGDDEIQVSEARTFTLGMGSGCSGNSFDLMDATGIEAFINIPSINFSGEVLTDINVNQNTMLKTLNLAYNEIIAIEVQNNLLLERLMIDNNQITNIDVSSNNLLTLLDLKSNPNLTQVNMANGNNANMVTVGLTNTPNLTCVQVDEGFIVPPAVNSAAGWSYDDASIFSYDCWQEDLAVAEQTKTTPNIQLYPNPAQDMVHIKCNAQIKSVSLYDMQGKHIKTVAGLAQISVADLPRGFYVVKVVTENGEMINKSLMVK